MMNITWVLADNVVLDPTINMNMVKVTGPIWGSWRTWRAYATDNVICHDMKQANELIQRDFHKQCNFYIANSVYAAIGRPKGVKLYEGDFMGHNVDCQDEIVAMNLAGSQSDIVLLLGFDWSTPADEPNTERAARAINHRGLVLQAVKSRPDVQWILVEHEKELMPAMGQLDNLGRDSFANVLRILRG